MNIIIMLRTVFTDNLVQKIGFNEMVFIFKSSMNTIESVAVVSETLIISVYAKLVAMSIYYLTQCN